MMEAHRKLQMETMTKYGEVIDRLDEVVEISIRRTIMRHKFTELQRGIDKEYLGCYWYVAWFIAQRACHTAEANALLLRHGFQDQAFELWRTLKNLRDNLENMIGDEQEQATQKFLNFVVAEMKYLHEEAKDSGSVLGSLFDDSGEDSIRELADEIEKMYGARILRKDGWMNPNPTATENRVGEPPQVEMDHLYRLASKLQHGAPISMMIGGDFDMSNPLRNPLKHNTDGVPIQCMMTGSMLHSIVTMFCESTAEKRDRIDESWKIRAEWALQAISQFHSP